MRKKEIREFLADFFLARPVKKWEAISLNWERAIVAIWTVLVNIIAIASNQFPALLALYAILCLAAAFIYFVIAKGK